MDMDTCCAYFCTGLSIFGLGGLLFMFTILQSGGEWYLGVSKEDFVDVFSVKAKHTAHSGILEAEALLLFARWALRSSKRQGKRWVILIDAKSVLGAAVKGRSSAKALLRVLRRLSAHVLAGDLVLKLVYIPTEDMPSDGASRGLAKRGILKRTDPSRGSPEAWRGTPWKGSPERKAAAQAAGPRALRQYLRRTNPGHRAADNRVMRAERALRALRSGFDATRFWTAMRDAVRGGTDKPDPRKFR